MGLCLQNAGGISFFGIMKYSALTFVNWSICLSHPYVTWKWPDAFGLNAISARRFESFGEPLHFCGFQQLLQELDTIKSAFQSSSRCQRTRLQGLIMVYLSPCILGSPIAFVATLSWSLHILLSNCMGRSQMCPGAP
jgi:hypothetical protein